MDKLEWDAPELARRYDAVSGSQYERCLALIDMIGIKEGSAVLDVGCGTGRMAIYVDGLVGPSGMVCGIDPSPHRIRLAREKLRRGGYSNVRLMEGRGEDLGVFPDNAFDGVYMCSVFHWINDKKAALREIYRVLRPEGKIGMTTGDKDNPSATKAITREVLSRPKYVGRVNMADDASQPVGKEELEGLLSAAGFVDVFVERRASKRHFDSAEAVFEFNEASSFGTFLRHVPVDLRASARGDIEAELEKLRAPGPGGIMFYAYTLYVTAVKPL
jgi:ubiquinone/menaquinone biosynthesis C-methylase UbiE